MWSGKKNKSEFSKSKPAPSTFKNFAEKDNFEYDDQKQGLRLNAPIFKFSPSDMKVIKMDPNKHPWMKELSPNGTLDDNYIVKTLMSKSIKYKNDVIAIFEDIVRDLSAKNQELFDQNLETVTKGKFDFKLIDTMEPTILNILCQCLDQFLRFKRDFLKGLSAQ